MDPRPWPKPCHGWYLQTNASPLRFRKRSRFRQMYKIHWLHLILILPICVKRFHLCVLRGWSRWQDSFQTSWFCMKMTRACWKVLCVCCVSCFKLIPAHTSMHRWCIRFCSGRQEIRCLESCSSRCSKLKQIIFRKNLQSCVQYWQRPPKKRKLPKSKQTVSDKFHWNQRSRNWRLCCWNISMPWSWSAIWVSCVFSVVFRGAKSFCNLSFSQALCSLQTAQSLKFCIFITKGCTGCYVWLVVS